MLVYSFQSSEDFVNEVLGKGVNKVGIGNFVGEGVLEGTTAGISEGGTRIGIISFKCGDVEFVVRA